MKIDLQISVGITVRIVYNYLLCAGYNFIPWLITIRLNTHGAAQRKKVRDIVLIKSIVCVLHVIFLDFFSIL